MRLISGLTLLLVTASAFGAQSVADDFRWSEHGRTLALRGDGEHVVVSAASPAPFLGLRAGDVVIAIDGRPLHAVGALMQYLRDSTAPVRLQVAHGDAHRTVVWTRADYRGLLPAPPPAPPTPPPPPPRPPQPRF